MKTKLLILLLLGLFSPLLVYGDNVPTKGEWYEDRYRSIVPAPPVLFIEGNVLNVHFTDALDDLTIRIMDHAGNIMYENVLSGEAGNVVDILLDGMEAGTYQVILTHELGWLVGEFEN
ncbi:DUF3244 domain-containing protein [Parabacteroides sp.]|uniref:DUF3244 domain-containing protein n=1 Tax=Parabacteroides sp. TaxID=1869337 RepID=UPI002580C7EE|nr:DUF3244 domain-containing protein [Parabacteroides sp.]